MTSKFVSLLEKDMNSLQYGENNAVEYTDKGVIGKNRDTEGYLTALFVSTIRGVDKVKIDEPIDSHLVIEYPSELTIEELSDKVINLLKSEF